MARVTPSSLFPFPTPRVGLDGSPQRRHQNSRVAVESEDLTSFATIGSTDDSRLPQLRTPHCSAGPSLHSPAFVAPRNDDDQVKRHRVLALAKRIAELHARNVRASANAALRAWTTRSAPSHSPTWRMIINSPAIPVVARWRTGARWSCPFVRGSRRARSATPQPDGNGRCSYANSLTADSPRP